ncbi:MAG: B12-binding domain-containing radical SAM protein [Bacteroidaceae bacterium]|nr:B12-binding domain-containing radical SAM protein [Bacteroidaceae bacterium]
MRVKMILPALQEAESPYWRPIKYALFPPLGLATLAAYFSEDDDVEIQDQHVEPLTLDDEPDLVCIQVYVTNAYRAYAIADSYRSRGVYVAMGGLHVTALPDEAALHADTILLGPGEEAFPRFVQELREGHPQRRYVARWRSLENIPPVRRDLIKRERYFVPNSLVVSRGCPHHCDFCYKDAFYGEGKSFYTQRVDDALAEIDRLPGRHLYFLDDHLLGSPRFATALFEGMRGMGRVFQSAATVASVLNGNLIEKAAEAGLRSVFLGFETFSPENLRSSNKLQNLSKDYVAAVERLHSLGIMINGSFVFGLDHDDPDVFRRTVDWGIEHSITTATYHILTPYPGTRLFRQMEREGRITSRDWSRYDTRTVVYKTRSLTPEQLKEGYDWAYREFYAWRNILKASFGHDNLQQRLAHLMYTGGWKKFEPFWNFMIRYGRLNRMLPLLEQLLAHTRPKQQGTAAIIAPQMLGRVAF